jgi:hypothetical protein
MLAENRSGNLPCDHEFICMNELMRSTSSVAQKSGELYANASAVKHALCVCANDLGHDVASNFRLTELERSRFEVKEREMRAE